MLVNYLKFFVHLLTFAMVITLPANAGEYTRDSKVSPSSVKEDKGTLEHEFEKGIVLPRLGRLIPNLPGFISESRLTPHFRTYSLSRKFSDKENPEAIAIGGELRYSSPQILNTFNIDAGYFISHGIHDDGGDGTLLLGSNASDINVLGKLAIKIPIQNLVFSLYRQEFNLPYLNKNDSRMIPNTHEAYVLKGEDKRLHIYCWASDKN